MFMESIIALGSEDTAMIKTDKSLSLYDLHCQNIGDPCDTQNDHIFFKKKSNYLNFSTLEEKGFIDPWTQKNPQCLLSMVGNCSALYAELPWLVSWAEQRHQPCLCVHQIRNARDRQNDEGS